MILIRPIISEKSVSEAGKKKYTFQVEVSANKTQVKKAVEKAFDVKVVSVQTIVVPGKTYRTGKKWLISQKSDWKKAIVTVAGDKTIDLFEVGKSEK
ncbi:50S ribosomal protein L23 [Candidatus Amesbacteria bacterium RIFOXYB1_FULL_44_23]|uniref:Large ribosomal subunit protein uL23 n=1 Tax=Candidatus Amesbacteria bacterium RIFOXYB1_FULL_44_23 TaxID=1797263 RepID=A0A1F4ZS66_9BACT|nr:MAG: 50S ribosomal protein L23 [Candidatus Amesbacteria bacterium RIFOXYB1_FULL_44_23]